MSAENYPISIKFVMQMKIFISRCTFYKQNDFSDSRWRTDAILKIVFGHISPPYWPINAKFGSKMKNHVLIQVSSPNQQFLHSRWRTAAILKITLCPYLRPELRDFDQIL